MARSYHIWNRSYNFKNIIVCCQKQIWYCVAGAMLRSTEVSTQKNEYVYKIKVQWRIQIGNDIRHVCPLCLLHSQLEIQGSAIIWRLSFEQLCFIVFIITFMQWLPHKQNDALNEILQALAWQDIAIRPSDFSLEVQNLHNIII